MIEIKEINYGLDTTMSDAPVIRKKGIAGPFLESTPFVWHGKLKWLHTVHVQPVENTMEDISRFVIRDAETDEVSEKFGGAHHFYSCYEENGVLYVFGSSDPVSPATGGDTIAMYRSDDLEHWEVCDVITRPGWEFFNTSVCKGRNGKYIMAIEAGEPQKYVGVRFTIFFAESNDLLHWQMMDDEIHYSDKRYTACPAIRYVPEDDYYYMVCLEELPLARYAPYIYRTHDFLTWEIGLHNPVMWISKEDRMLKPGVHLPKKHKEDAAGVYMNINNCDLDFCEFEGKTHIAYMTGNQMFSVYFCEAEYDGTLTDFLRAFFK